MNNKRQETMSISGLPSDIVTLALSFMSMTALLKFASTCKTYARLVAKIESDKCFAAEPMLKSSLWASHLEHSATSLLARAFPSYYDAMTHVENNSSRCSSLAAIEFIRLRLEHDRLQRQLKEPIDSGVSQNEIASEDPCPDKPRLVIGVGDLAATSIHRSYIFLRRENGVHPLCNLALPVTNSWSDLKRSLREARQSYENEGHDPTSEEGSTSCHSSCLSDIFSELEDDDEEGHNNRHYIFDGKGRGRYFMVNNEMGTAVPRALCCVPEHSPLLNVSRNAKIAERNVHFPESYLQKRQPEVASPTSTFSAAPHTSLSESTNGLSLLGNTLPISEATLKTSGKRSPKPAKNAFAHSSSSSVEDDSTWGGTTRVCPRSFSLLSSAAKNNGDCPPSIHDEIRNPVAEYTRVLTPTIPLSFRKDNLSAEIRQLFRLFAQFHGNVKSSSSECEGTVHLVIDLMCGNDSDSVQMDKWFHMVLNTIHQLTNIDKPKTSYSLLVDVDRLHLDRRYMRRFIRRLQMVGWSESNRSYAIINTNAVQLRGVQGFQKSMSLLADLKIQALLNPASLSATKELRKQNAVFPGLRNSLLRPNILKYFVAEPSPAKVGTQKLMDHSSLPCVSRQHLLNAESHFTLISCVPLRSPGPVSPQPTLEESQYVSSPTSLLASMPGDGDDSQASELSEDFDHDSEEGHPFTEGLTGSWVNDTHDAALAGFVYAFLKMDGLHFCSSSFYEVASAPLFPTSPFATLPPRYSTLPLLMKALMDGSYSSSLAPVNDSEYENGQGVVSLELDFRGKTGHHMPMLRDVNRYLSCHPFGRMNQKRSILRTVLREPEYTSSFVHHCSSVAERYWHHSLENYCRGFLLETTENEALSCAATLLKTEEVIATQNDGLQIAAALIYREEQELLEEQCLYAAMQLIQRFEDEVETNETMEGVAKLFQAAEQNALDHEKYRNVLLFVNEQELLRAEKQTNVRTTC